VCQALGRHHHFQVTFSLYLSRITTAEKLVKAGCGSIQDLRLPQFSSLLLGQAQKAKVRFMGHIEKPITKNEAEDVLVCEGSGRTLFFSQKDCLEFLSPKFGYNL